MTDKELIKQIQEERKNLEIVMITMKNKYYYDEKKGEYRLKKH